MGTLVWLALVFSALTIYLYTDRELPYGCFSNFSKHGFVMDKLWWYTTEHYFQAQKFVGTPLSRTNSIDSDAQ